MLLFRGSPRLFPCFWMCGGPDVASLLLADECCTYVYEWDAASRSHSGLRDGCVALSVRSIDVWNSRGASSTETANPGMHDFGDRLRTRLSWRRSRATAIRFERNITRRGCCSKPTKEFARSSLGAFRMAWHGSNTCGEVGARCSWRRKPAIGDGFTLRATDVARVSQPRSCQRSLKPALHAKPTDPFWLNSSRDWAEERHPRLPEQCLRFYMILPSAVGVYTTSKGSCWCMALYHLSQRLGLEASSFYVVKLFQCWPASFGAVGVEKHLRPLSLNRCRTTCLQRQVQKLLGASMEAVLFRGVWEGSVLE